eukprot:TRINITY_DN124078_c0_g1_i1.p1 TRINITY_DN124078_c0_g1~~TRINITY_DN124078_c0_g1_i1.p1  ORF type:complete len:349 (-),score=73.28 TRINITY_DN124078_c0_g1_i1:274-1281(-)
MGKGGYGKGQNSGGWNNWQNNNNYNKPYWKPYGQGPLGNMAEQFDSMLGNMTALGRMAQLGQTLAYVGASPPVAPAQAQAPQAVQPANGAFAGQSTAMSEALLRAINGNQQQTTVAIPGQVPGAVAQAHAPAVGGQPGNGHVANAHVSNVSPTPVNAQTLSQTDLDRMLLSSSVIRSIDSRVGTIETNINEQREQLNRLQGGQETQNRALDEILNRLRGPAEIKKEEEEEDDDDEEIEEGVPGALSYTQHTKWCELMGVNSVRACVTFDNFKGEEKNPVNYSVWRRQVMKAKTLKQWKDKMKALKVDEREYKDVTSLAAMSRLILTHFHKEILEV